MENEYAATPAADNAPGAGKAAAADNTPGAAAADKAGNPGSAASAEKTVAASETVRPANTADADNTPATAGASRAGRNSGTADTTAGTDKASHIGRVSDANDTPAGDKTGEPGRTTAAKGSSRALAVVTGASGSANDTRAGKSPKGNKPAADGPNAGKQDRSLEESSRRRSRHRSGRTDSGRTETTGDSGRAGRTDSAARGEKMHAAATGRLDAAARTGAARSDRNGDRARSRATGRSAAAGGSSRHAGVMSSSGSSAAAGSGSSRHAGRSEAPGRSDRSSANTNAGKTAMRWTWRDYVLQLSVVVIGIVVTFVGSGVIERWHVAREVRATMQLVHTELETNRSDFKEIWDYQQWEMRACKRLTDNRADLKRIPPDTLASFNPVYGRIHFFHPRRDAFEVLKNSGLMSSVHDKDFLLTVTQGYAALADLEENIGMYCKLKLTAQNDMSKAFSQKQRESFYTGDMYRMWECIFSVPWFTEFMLTAPYYFPEGYIEGLCSDVDRAAQAIETKYKTAD